MNNTNTYWIKVEEISEGLHPSEFLVTFKTKDNNLEQAICNRLFVDENNKLMRVYFVVEENDYCVVSLSQETISGSNRVLVSKDILKYS